MTDEESRKAFIDLIANPLWMNTSQNSVDGSFLSEETSQAFVRWQASGEYHTKRERERCAMACSTVENFANRQEPSVLESINLMNATQASVAANLRAMIVSGQEPTP